MSERIGTPGFTADAMIVGGDASRPDRYYVELRLAVPVSELPGFLLKMSQRVRVSLVAYDNPTT